MGPELIPDRRFAAWAFLVAIAYLPGIYGAPFMPRWWLIATGIPLVWDFRFSAVPFWPALLGLTALIWGGVTLLWTPALFGGELLLVFNMLLAAVFCAATRIQNHRIVLSAMGIGIGISSLIAIVQLRGGTFIPQSSVPGGLFFNSEVFAELAAPLAIWAAWDRRWVLLGFLAFPITVCDSRIALLSCAAGLLYGWRPKSPMVRPLVIVALFLWSLAALWIFGPEKLASAGQRLILWGAAVKSLTPFGLGVGWWYQAHPFPYEEYTHSDVLQGLVEYGWGGVAFILGIVVLWLGSRADKALKAACMAMAVECCVSFPLHLPASGFLAALLAGLLARGWVGVCDPRLSGRDRHGSSLRWTSP